MNLTPVILLINTAALVGGACSLIAVRMQYRRKSEAAVAAGKPPLPARPLLYLGLWLVWLFSAIVAFCTVYIISLS